MYQVNKDTPLDAKLIKKAIDYNEKRRTRFDTLDDYYMGKQAITTREKVETLMNNKLVTNHAKYITDMMVGYLLGNPVDYQVNNDINIQPVLDAYKRQTMENTDVEIAKECSIFGIKYEYVYADEEANPCSVTLDVRNTIMIYDDTLVHNELYAINYRPIYKNPEDKEPDHYDVIVATDKEIIKYELAGNGCNAKEIDREQHAFGAVPIIEYDNNKE
jgi:SPP1 family phage portal protein